MLKLLKRLLFEKIYIDVHNRQDVDLPDYLSLREIMDIPPHHPPAPAGTVRTARDACCNASNATGAS